MSTLPSTHRRVTRAALAVTSAAALSLALLVGTVLAWVTPTLQPLCASDENHYSWQITLPQEPDYWIQFSWSQYFTNPWSVDFGSNGDHQFDTDRGGSTLYARWLHDIAKVTNSAPNGDLCQQPTPSPEESVSETPSPNPEESVAETPSPTPEQSVAETPSPTPEESVAETPTPEESVAETSSPTPEQSVEAATGTPQPTVPDTAVSGGQPMQLPSGLPVAFLIISLMTAGTTVWARTRRR